MSAAVERPGRFARGPQPVTPEAAPLGTAEMIAIACKHRWRIVAAFLLPPLVALTLAVTLPKSYRAQADIVVKTGREYMAQGTGETANLTAPTSTKQESINSEVALLTSRAVAAATIEAVGLSRLYPAIVADPPSSGTVMDAAILRFGHDVSVDPVKLSNVISLQFDAASPALAREVVDTLVRVYIDKHTAIFAGNRADGYRDSIGTAMAEIRALEQRRSALKLGQSIYDMETQRKALIHQRVEYESRLEDATSRQAKLRARLAFLNDKREHVPATSVAAATEQSDTRIHAATALIDLRQQEASMAARLGDANPDLQRLREQIGATERAASTARRERSVTTGPSPIRQQIEAEAVTAGAELATTETEIERLQAFVAACRAELSRIERADLELRDLVLQIDVMTQNLRDMQGRYEQARANEQTDLARQVSVVQVAAASGPQRPVAPKKLVFGAAGVLGGALLAGLVALLTIATSKTAVTGEAAERRVGLPVLAVVPWRGDGPEPALGAP